MEQPSEPIRTATDRYPPGSYRQVMILAYPIVVSMLSQTFMWLIDTAMVGRIGVSQLGAVGLAGMMTWTFFSFFNGLMSSANTFVAQDHGAKQYDRIGKTVWHYLYIAIASYIILLFLIPFSGLMLKLIGASDKVEEFSAIYMKIRLYSGMGVFISFTMSGFFRGIGNTKTPMFIAIIANLFNVFCNYFLIFGNDTLRIPRLEVTGAAIATLMSSILSACLYLYAGLSRKYGKLYAIRAFYPLEFALARRLLWVGIPMGTQFLLDTGSFTVFCGLIARMGDAQLAATNAAMTLMSTSFMPLIAISIATTTLVGQFIGAGKLPQARKSGYTAIKVGIFYTIFMACCFFIIPRQLISLLSSDPEVISMGAKLLILAGLFQVSDALGICSNGALRGAGDTRFTMVVGILYAWLLFLPLSYFLGFTLKGGVGGAWVGATSYIIVYGITVLMRFRRGKWESIKI